MSRRDRTDLLIWCKPSIANSNDPSMTVAELEEAFGLTPAMAA